MGFYERLMNSIGRSRGENIIVAKAVFDIKDAGTGAIGDIMVSLFAPDLGAEKIERITRFEHPADFWMKASYTILWTQTIFYESCHIPEARQALAKCLENISSPDLIDRNRVILSRHMKPAKINGKQVWADFCLSREKRMGVFVYNLPVFERWYYELYLLTSLLSFFMQSFSGGRGYIVRGLGYWFALGKTYSLQKCETGMVAAAKAADQVMAEIIGWNEPTIGS